jgi:lysophospholipase L1-like esterase
VLDGIIKAAFYLLLCMLTYIALGDSYTIGEQVAAIDNFPNQTAALLSNAVTSPKIIATTGWTTDELDAAINKANITGTYNIVSLLIGVNNQYRGRSVSNFIIEFEHLLQRAIMFAADKPNNVFVLSIPDWGVTPFAEGRDNKKIAEEIDAYNKVCETAAAQFGTHYIDITTAQRIDGNKEDFLAEDKLHPSTREYAKWAAKLAALIKQQFGL